MGYLIWINVIILGWFLGVLVNYFSDVLPIFRRLSRPVCVHCHEPVGLWNYLLWPRRCVSCSLRRPVRAYMVELIYMTLSVYLWFNPTNKLDYYWGLILLVFFGVVVVIDIEHRLILHPVSIVGSVLSLGIGWSLHGWQSTLIGGIAGFVIMYGLHLFGDRFARWLARKRGEVLTEVALGFGDVNLSGILGLLLGWPGVIGGLLVAFILGGVFSLVYLIWMVVTRRYQTFAVMPYGPFLVGSGVLLLYFL